MYRSFKVMVMQLETIIMSHSASHNSKYYMKKIKNKMPTRFCMMLSVLVSLGLSQQRLNHHHHHQLKCCQCGEIYRLPSLHVTYEKREDISDSKPESCLWWAKLHHPGISSIKLCSQFCCFVDNFFPNFAQGPFPKIWIKPWDVSRHGGELGK